MSKSSWIGIGIGTVAVTLLGAWWYFGVSRASVVSVSQGESQPALVEGAAQEEISPQPESVPETSLSQEEVVQPSTSESAITASETPKNEPKQPEVTIDTAKKDTEKSDTKSSSSKLSLKNRLVSFGFSSSTGTRSIDTIVVHSSYNALGGDVFDTDKVIQEYKDAGVSPHYVVTRGGTVYRLVKENDIAWHAGTSKMPKDGRTNVNDFSIGIEMIGTLESGYTDDQYAALNALIKDIKSRYSIKYIVGHDDIAPGRKTDPWKFEWSRVKK